MQQAIADAPVKLREELSDRLHRAYSAGASGGGGGVVRRPVHRLDRNAAPLRRADGVGRGVPYSRRAIRVIVPDTGSGYGGKHTGEAAIEAARLARAAGKPVKLVWTREEEFTWAYSGRPA